MLLCCHHGYLQSTHCQEVLIAGVSRDAEHSERNRSGRQPLQGYNPRSLRRFSKILDLLQESPCTLFNNLLHLVLRGLSEQEIGFIMCSIILHFDVIIFHFNY